MTAQVTPSWVVGFDGQSLPLVPSPASAAYPAKVMAAFSAALGPVVARGGTGWNQRSADAAQRVDRQLRAVTGPGGLVDCGGTTEIAIGSSGAVTFAAAEAYWTARIAAGWTVIACTTPPSTVFTGPQEAQRLIFNDLVRGSLLPAGVADLAADPLLDDPSDLTYYSDGTHFTGAGATAAAAVITPVVAAVLGW